MSLARIRKDDTVEVIAGKDRGKRGKVRQVMPKDDRAVVADINVVKKHVKPGARGARQAGIIQMEMPIHISNLMPVCPKCSRPARVGTRILENGSKVRFCKKCGEQW
jgi:large subunit ribosomal protein L24